MTGIWLLIATKYQLPVSTTHSVVGSIIGMALAAKGAGCIVWFETTDTFPYFTGVAAIVFSWILSPVLCGLASAGFFYLLRAFVLRSENSYNRVFMVWPVCLSLTLIIYIFFIIYKGAKGLGLNDTPLSIALIWAFGFGLGIHIFTWPFIKWLKKYTLERF